MKATFFLVLTVFLSHHSRHPKAVDGLLAREGGGEERKREGEGEVERKELDKGVNGANGVNEPQQEGGGEEEGGAGGVVVGKEGVLGKEAAPGKDDRNKLRRRGGEEGR